jgi:hypothetical protein
MSDRTEPRARDLVSEALARQLDEHGRTMKQSVSIADSITDACYHLTPAAANITVAATLPDMIKALTVVSLMTRTAAAVLFPKAIRTHALACETCRQSTGHIAADQTLPRNSLCTEGMDLFDKLVHTIDEIDLEPLRAVAQR